MAFKVTISCSCNLMTEKNVMQKNETVSCYFRGIELIFKIHYNFQTITILCSFRFFFDSKFVKKTTFCDAPKIEIHLVVSLVLEKKWKLCTKNKQLTFCLAKKLTMIACEKNISSAHQCKMCARVVVGCSTARTVLEMVWYIHQRRTNEVTLRNLMWMYFCLCVIHDHDLHINLPIFFFALSPHFSCAPNVFGYSVRVE